MQKQFISEVINVKDIKKDHFNLIVSGCGTGKSYWVANDMLNQFDGLLSDEVIFITSRSLTVEQQAQSEKSLIKHTAEDIDTVLHWNGETDEISKSGIRIMSYYKFVGILLNLIPVATDLLSRVKIIIFDECHTLFSDKFMKHIDLIKLWIRERIIQGTKVIIGMTATPDIIHYYRTQWGVRINQLNKKPLINYSPSEILCTEKDTFYRMLNEGELQGKTLIMCSTISECFELNKSIPNSAVLVSRYNEHNTEEMEYIRAYISEHCKFPDTYSNPVEWDDYGYPSKYEKTPLNTLICTSTAREGYTLIEQSGVRNIVSMMGDSLHVIQICGRARYDIDKLIVVDIPAYKHKERKTGYFEDERKKFTNYLYGDDDSWLDTVAPSVKYDKTKIIKYIYKPDYSSLISYIDTRWIATGDKIFLKPDKEEIIEKYVECTGYFVKKKTTFNMVMRFIQEELGYKIEEGRIRDNGTRYIYKRILPNIEKKEEI